MQKKYIMHKERNTMFNESWSAQSAEKIWAEHKEKEAQPKKQTIELQKQTAALTDVKELTRVNIECIQSIVDLNAENTKTVKQIAQMTEENQKSSTKQFIASIIVSAAALIIAFSSLIISILQLYK